MRQRENDPSETETHGSRPMTAQMRRCSLSAAQMLCLAARRQYVRKE